MARTFDRTQQHYAEATPGATGYPLTFACWFKTSDLSNNHALMSLGDTSGDNDCFELLARGAVSGDPVSATVRAGGTESNANSTTGYSSTAWNHACAVFASSTNRAVFLNGGNKGTSTADRAPAPATAFRIGRRALSSVTAYAGATIAEAAMWNVALSDEEVAALASGISPVLIRRENLIGYWPLLGIGSPEREYTGRSGDLVFMNGTPDAANHSPSQVFFGLSPLEPYYHVAEPEPTPDPPAVSEILNVGMLFQPQTTRWEVWINNPSGERVALVSDLIGVEYTRVLNDVGSFTVEIPLKYLPFIAKDSIIEIWRGAPDAPLKWAFAGFVRRLTIKRETDGNTYLIVSGFDGNDLLRRRIVAYPEGSSQAEKTGPVDDLLRDIVRENLGSQAGATRDLTPYGFDAGENLSLGPTVTHSFAYREVLSTLQEICDRSAALGTRLFFDIVPAIADTGRVTFQFQVMLDHPAADHSVGSNQPVFFGDIWGNLDAPELEHDWTDEATFCYAAGAGGTGLDDSRLVRTAQNDGLANAAPIWGRVEVYADGRRAASSEELIAEARAKLAEHSPVVRFTGDLLDTRFQRFGREWDHGDLVTARFMNTDFTGLVRASNVGRDANGEDFVRAKFEPVETLFALNAPFVPVQPTTVFPPADLEASAASSSQIDLQWVNVDPQVATNRIYRSTDGITFTEIDTVSGSEATYSDTGLNPSTAYYYYVIAERSNGDTSVPSNTAQAETSDSGGYYVSPLGNDSNPGTIDQPWKTVPFALSQLSAGDTLWIRNGTYTHTSSIFISGKNGTEGNEIKVKAFPGETVILDAGGVNDNRFAFFSLDDCSYWHIDGLIIQNATGGPTTNFTKRGMQLIGNSSNNRISNMEFRFNQGTGLHLEDEASNNVIENCVSHHNYDSVNGGINADGFAVKSDVTAANNEFFSCLAYQNSDDGWDVRLGGPTIMKFCIAHHNGYDQGDGSGFKLGMGNGGHMLIQCMAWGNPNRGFNQNNAANPCYLYNCTAWDNGLRDYYFDDGEIAHEFKNCIGRIDYLDITASAIEENNSWNLDIEDDIGFASLDEDDPAYLSLSESSNAREVGVDGSAWGLGTEPDLGALQYPNRWGDIL